MFVFCIMPLLHCLTDYTRFLHWVICISCAKPLFFFCVVRSNASIWGGFTLASASVSRKGARARLVRGSSWCAAGFADKKLPCPHPPSPISQIVLVFDRLPAHLAARAYSLRMCSMVVRLNSPRGAAVGVVLKLSDESFRRLATVTQTALLPVPVCTVHGPDPRREVTDTRVGKRRSWVLSPLSRPIRLLSL